MINTLQITEVRALASCVTYVYAYVHDYIDLLKLNRT